MQKNTADWHRADVVAALKKVGWSVRALSIASGLGPNTLKNALGMKPEDIWPQRYAARNFRPTLRKVANA